MPLSCCLLQSIIAPAACTNTTCQIAHNPVPGVPEIEEEHRPLFASRRLWTPYAISPTPPTLFISGSPPATRHQLRFSMQLHTGCLSSRFPPDCGPGFIVTLSSYLSCFIPRSLIRRLCADCNATDSRCSWKLSCSLFFLLAGSATCSRLPLSFCPHICFVPLCSSRSITCVHEMDLGVGS